MNPLSEKVSWSSNLMKLINYQLTSGFFSDSCSCRCVVHSFQKGIPCGRRVRRDVVVEAQKLSCGMMNTQQFLASSLHSIIMYYHHTISYIQKELTDHIDCGFPIGEPPGRASREVDAVRPVVGFSQ